MPKTRIVDDEFSEGRYMGECQCGYKTWNWKYKKDAQLRLDAHLNEHETGELMLPVNEFIEQHGIEL